ncbi:MAG: ABC transporter ATP-binding protein [Coprothermobacterota bacterium]|nr:ABC transporter ATP-binding protein [Coprothermobacterota bacterium]
MSPTADLVVAENALELRGITKTFPGVLANQSVDLTIRKGEIHALLGENGAGKSTLMNILTGLYTPDAGKIFIHGKEVHIRNPKDAIASGIGMVHQHFKLVEELKVYENIIIGWKEQGWLLNQPVLVKHIADLSARYNLPVDPNITVRDLSAGQKQRVEIIKMLYRNMEFLILDEPTSVLTPQETEKLFVYLREMKTQGKTVIFISHKLNEVMEIADRVTVLREGRLIRTMDKDQTSPKELARMMIGREMETIAKIAIDKEVRREPVLVAEGLTAKGDEGQVALKGVSFTIEKGEILGLAGVSGNGQSELAEALTGMRPLEAGTVSLNQKEIKGATLHFIQAGISHIPEDRIGTGSIPSFSCIDNVILKSYRKPPIRRGWTLNHRKAEEIGGRLLKEYDVRMSSPNTPIKLLSGGNMQKLILAREISCGPKLIVAVHPTYGLDICAVEMVHNYLIQEQKRGCAILLISEDLDEILTLSDSIAVIYKGEMTSKKHRNDWTIETLGCAMMGIPYQTEESADVTN